MRHSSDARSRVVTAGVVVTLGLIASGVLAWAAWQSYEQTEDRLAAKSVKEAGAVLGAAIPAVEQPLSTAAGLVDLVSTTDEAVFAGALARHVGDGRRYAGAALLDPDEGSVIFRLGDVRGLDPERMSALAPPAEGMQVVPLLDPDAPRLGYAMHASGGEGRVIYAEQVLPPDRMNVPQPDSAFAGMRYALYLDREETYASLVIANTKELPLTGRRAEETIRFGDRELLLVMVPKAILGGRLLWALPWLVLGGGAALSMAAATLTVGQQSRRADAEHLADENRRLYELQRRASTALQRSLLPVQLPVVDGLEIAAAYAAGTNDTEVGGDWYDVVIAGRRVTASVGDVSGRGLDAAAVMASVRYGMKVPASQGAEPETVLNQMAHLGGGSLRGRFATVLCAVIDIDERRLRLASAGHLPALLIAGGDATWVEPATGPPIGVAVEAEYTGTMVDLPERATIVLVTDGLVERRGEVLDEGLERLRLAALELAEHQPQAIADGLLTTLIRGDADDDAAVLVLRCTR